MRAQGYSYLELCTVIAIIAILFGFGVPTFYQTLMRQERELVLGQLQMAIDYARQEALIRHKTVTICSSINQKTCIQEYHLIENWSNGFIIVENSKNPLTPASQNILKVFPGTCYGKLYFKRFRQHLIIKTNGATLNDGSFYYCPLKYEQREVDGLIINKGGRTYRPIKHPTLGIPLKNSDDDPFVCP